MGTVCNPPGSVPGSPLWSLSAFLDPFCTPATTANTIMSVSPTNPNSPMNPNACYGGGPLLDSSACLAANAQAASAVAAGDPTGQVAYDCSQSNNSFLCYLGIVDANGNMTSSGLLTLLALGIGLAVLTGGKH